MVVPRTPAGALSWIQIAFRKGRYTPLPHFNQRLTSRGISIDDARAVVQRARSCEAYPGRSERGGSAWRIRGKDLSGRPLAIGVEAYIDEDGQAALRFTIFETKGQAR